MKSRDLILVGLLLMPPWVLAGEPAQTLVAADLKREPYADAATILSLPAASAVEVIKRQGGWMHVKSADGKEGWLKMVSIKLGAGAAAKGDTGLGSLLNVARSGRSGNTGVTVATGVRGLSAEDLKNAKPAPEALKRLDSLPNGKREGESFASAGRLQAQKIDYLGMSQAATDQGANTFGGGR
ncbi:MAG TPA: SH3 domain-containing protein [Methylophilaceae bacterium]|nr:SH3 domain-containing protein [Methylophilaceae bacterium]